MKLLERIGQISDRLYNFIMNEELIAALKEVLADEYSLYFKAKGYHWNVEGIHFVQFHELFENIASDVYGETDVSTDCHSMAMDLLMATEQILICINRAFAIASAANEQGIADFLAGRDASHKKWAWQLRVSLKG